MTSEEFHVNFATGKQINLDEIRCRAEAFMKDGEHAWVINTVFGLDDPEQALDDMSLDAENFIGVTAIHCLLCRIEYLSLIRHFKCPQRPPS